MYASFSSGNVTCFFGAAASAKDAAAEAAAPKDRQAVPGLNVDAAPQLAGASVRPSFEISAGILVYCMHIAARSVQADIA